MDIYNYSQIMVFCYHTTIISTDSQMVISTDSQMVALCTYRLKKLRVNDLIKHAVDVKPDLASEIKR